MTTYHRLVTTADLEAISFDTGHEIHLPGPSGGLAVIPTLRVAAWVPAVEAVTA